MLLRLKGRTLNVSFKCTSYTKESMKGHFKAENGTNAHLISYYLL